MAKLKQAVPTKTSNIKPGDIVTLHPSYTTFSHYTFALAVAEGTSGYMLVLLSQSEFDIRMAAQEFIANGVAKDKAGCKLVTLKKTNLVLETKSTALKPITIQDLADSRFANLLDD